MTSWGNRHVRRQVAREQMPRVEALAYKVRVNKPDTSHVTVWLNEQARAEWWPGSHKWAFDFGDDSGTLRGSVTDFIEWLRTTRPALPRHPGTRA